MKVEADYGKLKLSVCRTAMGDKLVFQGSASHRTFHLWVLPSSSVLTEALATCTDAGPSVS